MTHMWRAVCFYCPNKNHPNTINSLAANPLTRNQKFCIYYGHLPGRDFVNKTLLPSLKEQAEDFYKREEEDFHNSLIHEAAL